MAVYRGKIDLVNMSDITASAGVGIRNAQSYYLITDNGRVPPDLASTELVTIEGDILSFSSVDSSFQIIDNILWAQQNGENIRLITDSNYISGVAGWEAEIPELVFGSYLWTKTIFNYTNGDSTVTYNVSHQGADGAPGPQGPAGLSGSTYRIQPNQTEILKFVDLNGNVTFSPENLVISIFKDANYSDDKKYSEQVVNLVKEDFLFEIYDLDVDTYTTLPNELIILDQQEHTFNIDLYNINQDIQAFKLLLEKECIVKISYNLSNEEGNFYLVNYINVRYGMNKDMASLSVKANGIVQAIQQTKLEFDATGLTIQNGGLKILDLEGNEILSSTNGNLVVTGTVNANNGYFAGELRSESGFFRGEITARSGDIGGFIISEEKLASKKTYVSSIENGEEIFSPNIVLNGTTGEIFAQDITLGTGAIINDYIKLGEAYIYNPDKNEDNFIKAGNISLNQNGILKLGTIQLHGGDLNTQAYLKSENENWLIREDGVAIFNDIYANNVHLQDTILEIGTVQAMGSLMIFKDSWSIAKVDNNIITIQGLTTLSINDWIYSGKNIYQIIDIQIDTDTILTLNKVYSLDDGLTIIKFGQDFNNSIPGFIFSILGEQSILNDKRKFASGNALTISDFEEENGTLNYRKRLILGQLDGAIDENIKGLGLYADNVFLNGSLTTKVDQDSYAGVNTIGEANAIVFEDNDKSRIVFWAGSASSSNIDIQNAPFQVTEQGSIYARKGIFRDSIISDSVIQGADIYAARIHGGTTDEANALTIYDTSKGIIFKEGYNDNEKEIFSIRTEGLQQNNDFFIEILNNQISFYGDKFVVDTRENNYLELISNNIQGIDLSMKVISDGLVSEKSYQNFTNDKISFGFTQTTDREDSIIIDKDKTQIKSLSVWLEKDIYFGTELSYMQYKKVEGGYDLFINE